MLLVALGCSEFALVGEPAVPVDDTSAATVARDTAAIPDSDVAETDRRSDLPHSDVPASDVPVHPSCRRILVYSTESRWGSDSYVGWFDGLPADLPGWDVEVRERVNDGPLTAEMLADRSELWIFGTDPARGAPFEGGQIAAIRDFVRAGNGLLLAAEQDDGAYDYTDEVNSVAALYGVTFSGSLREGNDGSMYHVDDRAGPLVADVRWVPAFGSTARVTITDPAVNVAFTLWGNQAVSWRDDGARVVFDRSWCGYRDRFRGHGDQAAFIENVATFLERCR